MIKISVIIPVYNSSKFLAECLESVISQELKEIEIIVVNDGSTDNSLEIIKKYEKIDNRIILIDKVNEGQSKARNIGIKLARGKYIGFIDSDDYIPSDYYKKLYLKIEKENSEIVVCGVEIIDSSRNNIKMEIVDYTHKIDFLFDKKNFGFPVNKLYRKDILDEKNIYFDESLKLSEDFLFNLQYLLEIEKISSVLENYYCYRKHSTNTTKNQYLYVERFKVIEKSLEFLKNEQLDDITREKMIEIIIRQSFLELNFYYLEELKLKKDEYWKELYIEVKKFYYKNKIYFSLKNRIYFNYRRGRLIMYKLKPILRNLFFNKK